MSITAEKATDRYINILNKFGEWKEIYEEYEKLLKRIEEQLN